MAGEGAGQCDGCGGGGGAGLRCVCGDARYCSPACQRADWPRHRPACPPVTVREVPGRGRGLVATRKVRWLGSEGLVLGMTS